MMDWKLIASFGSYSAIISACIAGTFAAISSISKSRNESKQSARILLLYMLEIRTSILRALITPEEMIKQYWEYYFKHLDFRGIIYTEADKGIAEKIPMDPIRSVFSLYSQSLDGEFSKNYLLHLQNYAKDDPVLAWKIKGEELTDKLMQLKSEYMEQISSMPEISDSNAEILEYAQSVSTQEINSDVLNNFDSLLMQLAAKCGRSIRKECYEITKNKKTAINFDEIGIDKLIDKIIKDAPPALLSINPNK